MKQNLIILFIAAFVIAATGSSMAADMTHDMEHGMSMEKTDHEMHQMEAGKDGGMAMDHSGHSGENIHNSVVEGYRFSYHLTDIREKMAAMKAAGHAHAGMDATHHLMVYVRDPEGMVVGNATVGYLVQGPDGSEQKLMCMGMGDGFGSDVNFSGSGDYIVKTKVVADGEKLIDDFTYTAK